MRVAGRGLAVLVLSLAMATGLTAGAAQAAANGRIEAESYTAQRGTFISPAPFPTGGFIVDGVSHRDWLRYDGVTAERVRYTLVCFTSPDPVGAEVGTLDIHLRSPWSAPIMSIPMRVNISGGAKQLAFGGSFPDGTHTVFIRVRQPYGASPFALDYLLLTEAVPPPTLNCF